jgi:hypothetical protein
MELTCNQCIAGVQKIIARNAQPTPSPYLGKYPAFTLSRWKPKKRLPSGLLDLSGNCQTVSPATTRDAIVMAIFSTNCTLPPHGTIFVQPPNARGTLDIVYSCLAVIVLCTWSVLHLNVPVQITPATRPEKLMRSMVRTFTKVACMAFNVLAPEWPFAQAISGLKSERKLRGTFDHYKKRDQVPWTGSHTQLANMGGFVIRFDQTLLQPDRVAGQREDTQCVVDEYCCDRRWNVDLAGILPQSADRRLRPKSLSSKHPNFC